MEERTRSGNEYNTAKCSTVQDIVMLHRRQSPEEERHMKEKAILPEIKIQKKLLVTTN